MDQALEEHLPIHDYHLRMWGNERADEINATSFHASRNWLTGIKKKCRLAFRKVTDLVSDADARREPDRAAQRREYLDNYRQFARFFPRHRISNTDQSGNKYELSNLRTLGRIVSRDHLQRVQSRNKNTHSYTIQPLIGRDGLPRGKLLICFQEPNGTFGARIEPRVRELEHEYGNIIVVASSSGKMSRYLIQRWAHETVIPVMNGLKDLDREYASSSDGQETQIAEPSWFQCTLLHS